MNQYSQTGPLGSCLRLAGFAGIIAAAILGTASVSASSHMDAPLITFDDPANITDVYAFVSKRGEDKYLTVGMGVYPFEEPGVGPNKYNFDPEVLYEFHLSMGDDLATGEDTISYQCQFNTSYKNRDTILQSYLGVVEEINDANQNLTQLFAIAKLDHRTNSFTTLGTGIVPPNNQGIATPYYNVDSDGNNPARPGVDSEDALDRYTEAGLVTLGDGYRVFAGQREDAFYGDIQAIFDLLNLRSGSESFDSQSGFNTHVIMLDIPLSDILGDDLQQVGVHATTSRLRPVVSEGVQTFEVVQVGRMGNPLFNEALVAIEDKDRYNRTKPTDDATLFAKYAENPELAALINAIIFKDEVAPTTGRTDIAGIYIPDVIKVDLSTEPARLAGGRDLADDDGFSRLSIFGGDVLESQIQDPFGNGGFIPGGWPNGRRFGDDVIDIAVTALISDLRTDPLTIRSADGIDNVNANDSTYNKVFPYAGTPHNGRNSKHNAGMVVQCSPRLFNISTRGKVGLGHELLIGGIIVTGDEDEKLNVIFRGLGRTLRDVSDDPNDPLDDPSLEVLGDPKIVVWKGDSPILENDDWKSAQEAEIVASGFAPLYDEESAVIGELEPGFYTVHIFGANSETGLGMFDAHIVE